MLLLCVAPLLGVLHVDIGWVATVSSVLALLLLVAIRRNHHLNPLLMLFGWSFYKVKGLEGYSYVLITRRHLEKIRASQTICELTRTTLLDVGKREEKWRQ